MPTKNPLKIKQLQAQARTNNANTSVAALLQLSKHYNNQKSNTALKYAIQALDKAAKYKLKPQQLLANLELAKYYYHTATEYVTSMKYCEQAKALITTNTPSHELAEIYKVTGVNYHYLGEINKAQQNYLSSLDILLSLKATTYDEIKDIADLYYNMAILNRSEEASDLRKEYIDRAFQYYSKIDFPTGMARCADGLAIYYYYKNDYRAALEKLLVAIEIYKQIGNDQGIYMTCNNIGTLKIEMGQFDEGMKYLHQSLQLRKKTGNTVAVAIAYINIGTNWLEKKKEYKKALTYLKRGEKLLVEANSKVEQAPLLQAMGNCYAGLGNHKKAYQAMLDYIKLREELHKFELKKAYSDTKLRYDVELVEKDAIIDRLQNFEIATYIHRLEMSNNELRQFAHAVSHDLKEPLRTITGFSNLLEKKYKGRLDEQGDEYIKYITTGATRLNDLVKDILDLSNINVTESTLVNVDLNKVYADVVKQMQAVIKQKNAVIKSGKLPTVQADKVQMHRLFTNIITNAINYNNSKTPEVKIKSVKDGRYYKISFTDNGIGIPEQYHDKVFEIFQRLHHRENYSGTGMGLTVCKKIVDRHLGKIWVEKNKSEGSVFYVTLPI
jgi:signal transduction histidine kinase